MTRRLPKLQLKDDPKIFHAFVGEGGRTFPKLLAVMSNQSSECPIGMKEHWFGVER